MHLIISIEYIQYKYKSIILITNYSILENIPNLEKLGNNVSFLNNIINNGDYLTHYFLYY